MDYLFNWMFHYNAHRKQWETTTREFYPEIFSNASSKNIIRSTKIETLVALIQRDKGDLNAIKQRK